MLWKSVSYTVCRLSFSLLNGLIAAEFPRHSFDRDVRLVAKLATEVANDRYAAERPLALRGVTVRVDSASERQLPTNSHSKMKVYKKLKRAFSFKKDKESKREKRGGKDGTGEVLAANGSLERNASDEDVKNGTPQKYGKKRSFSFTSLIRKSSFSKKNADKVAKKPNTQALAHSSTDMRPPPALLSNAAVPRTAASTEPLGTSTSQVVAVVEPTTKAPPSLPPRPLVDAELEQTQRRMALDAGDGPTLDEKLDEEIVVTITDKEFAEIKAELEAELAAPGDDGDARKSTTPAEAEWPTVTDLVNLLSRKPDPTMAVPATTVAATDATD
ncbi:hypothetical protein BIW11_04885, partial [Tropilaelaps mercedesae]